MLSNAPSVDRSRSAQDRADDGDVSVGALVALADKGDEQAWNALVDRYTGLLWSIASAHRLGKADAADVAQTTWLRLVENLHQIREPERLASWLITTARRECLRVLALGRREDVGTAEDIATDMADDRDGPPDTALLLDERDAALWRCFQQLSERCQTILRILMASPPPSYAAVSTALDLPIGSIGPTRGRCLDRLREHVAAAGLASADAQIGTVGRQP